MISRTRLALLLDQFPRLTIGVVGDLFLDRYLAIAPGVHELSVETGLEAYQIPSVGNSPGAVGTVMNNLAALGVGRLVPVTVIGDDGHGYDLRQELAKLPVDTAQIVLDPNRLTPTYTKPLRQEADGHWNELNRFDVRSRGPLSDKTTELVCRHVQDVFQATDGLIVLDQVNEENWGVVNVAVRQCLGELSKSNADRLVFIDSRNQLNRFDFGVLKGNGAEISAAVGRSEADDQTVREASTLLATKTGQPVYCTLGPDGVLVARPGLSYDVVPGFPTDGPIDICGAGDSVTSGIVCSWLVGAGPLEAALIGNLVASITVQQLGTTGTATPKQILERWLEASANDFPMPKKNG